MNVYSAAVGSMVCKSHLYKSVANVSVISFIVEDLLRGTERQMSSVHTRVSNSQNLYEQGLLFCLDVLFAWEQLFSCYIVLTSYFLHQCSDSHALEIFEWYCESNYFSCVEMWDMCPSLLLLFLCVKRIGYLSCSIWEASCRFSSW